MEHDPSARGVTWALTGPGSLTSVSSRSVVYNAPTGATLTGPQQATVTATSAEDNSRSASVQITVNPYLEIPNQTLASGSVGVPYDESISFTGGTPPFQWIVYDGPILTGWRVGGSLPDGLRLDPNTGRINGTPTAAGTWYFDGVVTDAKGASVGDGFFSIEIKPNAPPGNPVPFLNQTLEPTAVAPGSGSFAIHASGTGFVSGATIDFNGAPLSTTFIDSEHLSAVVPARRM